MRQTGPYLGVRTRGKTAQGRLAFLDAYMLRYERGLLMREAPSLFVDLGYGDRPWTTLESARLYWELNPSLSVVGVELEAHRIENATQEFAQECLEFRRGGFALPLKEGESARLVRAMNVLRQYRPEEVPQAHALMAANLEEGGLLLEGTCDKHGQVMGVYLLRQQGDRLLRESLLMATDFSRGFAPIMFRDQLPQDMRRSVVPGRPIHAFFEAWMSAWKEVRVGGGEPAELFARSLKLLACRIAGVATDPWLLQHGYARWSPPGGVPVANINTKNG